MKRYQNQSKFTKRNETGAEMAKTARFFSQQPAKGIVGDTWDAKHMGNFLRRSNYSNWSEVNRNISKLSGDTHKRSYSSVKGDHFFKTTRDDKNMSKIGFTPIFPLVINSPVQQVKELSIREFLESVALNSDRQIGIKLRCNPQQNFKFEGNSVKFKHTDPLTLTHENQPPVSGFQKQRMSRLIDRRHPHGMTGIDHPQRSNSTFYSVYEQKTKIRQQPNSHKTFLLDRDWNSKKHSIPPIDQWKTRKTTAIRKFRNQDTHGYNILTNRFLSTDL